MLSFTMNGGGPSDEPLTSDNYKRAVFCPAPHRFSVEFLTPARQGGAYSLGMRICPMSLGDLDSSSSNGSVSSKGSISEYDIWRRWEDCLWFQDTLESEYKRSAREKRQRLLQGKGVKSFNGMYKQDMASSWESLPPGPDPNSVARDIHRHIPFLTKKGTLFRASLATVEKRQREFEALIEALFRDDMPALIKEIRSSRIVTDFFGFWRRDYDLAERNRKAGQPHSAVRSIVYSMYFSHSPSDSDKDSSSRSPPLSPVKGPPRTSEEERPRWAEDCGHNSRRWGTDDTDVFTIPVVPPRRRAESDSSDSSSSWTDTSSDCPAFSNTPSIANDAPFIFGHNPVQAPDATFSVSSLLVPFPEEQELEEWRLEDYKTAYLRRPKYSEGDRPSNRHCSIFISPPNGLDFARNSQHSPTEENAPADSRLRESWQTTTSNATYLEDLGLTTESSCRSSMASIATFMTTDSANAAIPIRPTTPPPNALSDSRLRESWQTTSSNAIFLEDLGLTAESSCRSSMTSIATFMTTDSANAAIPIRPTTPPPSVAQHFVKPNSRISVPVSLSDYEMWSESEEDTPALLDEFPRPTSYFSDHVDSRPETPLGYWNSDDVPESTEPLSSLSVRESPSPTASTFSTAPSFSSATTHFTTTAGSSFSSSATSGSVSIKAAYDNSIIMLRVSRDIPFSDLRQRLYNKFAGQEGVPISHAFVVASMPPKSLTAQGSALVSCAANEAHMELIDCQSEWEQLAASSDGSKLTLRILDGPP